MATLGRAATRKYPASEARKPEMRSRDRPLRPKGLGPGHLGGVSSVRFGCFRRGLDEFRWVQSCLTRVSSAALVLFRQIPSGFWRALHTQFRDVT